MDECQEDYRYKFHWEGLWGTHINPIREGQKLFLCHPDSTENKLRVYQPSEVFAISCLSCNHQFSSVQSLSRVQLFVTPWTAACQASQAITSSRSLLKLMSIESGMPSNYLILCCPLLPLPSIIPSISVFPSIRVLSSESVLCIRWPKYWSFSFSISPSN